MALGFLAHRFTPGGGRANASASSTLSLAVQYWTGRGIGVLDVNYRGSTGHGRLYWLRLERQWGILDVQDCVQGARYLVANRNADPDRLMISGQRRRLYDDEPIQVVGLEFVRVAKSVPIRH
jgi:dipeptidyl aminopeptidase/acylaminoacyl peptidase